MIGKLIQQERKSKGWSQVELAKNAGVSFLTINRIEQEKNSGSSVISKVVKALGMEIVYSLRPLPNMAFGEMPAQPQQENVL